MVSHASSFCAANAQQLSVLMLESQGKSFHFVMPLGVWIQFLEPSLSTRGVASKFFSRKQEVPALSSAEAEIISIVETAKEIVSIGMLLQTVIQGIPLDPLGMPQQTIGEMGLRMFNDAKAAISMGKMDGLLRRVRHLELRVKYCQHLHKTRKLSITHWKGEENPSDGLTKSLRPLSLWTNLVEAVGLVPGPTDQGSNWIRNYLNLIQQESDLDTFLALPFVASKKGISR